MFGEFCGGPVWNETLLIHNTWPEFTPCFRDTVLVWVPSGFLWLTSTAYLYFISSTLRKQIPISRLNISKTITSCILIILSIINVTNLSRRDNTTWAHLTGYVIKAVTYLLTILLMQIDRRHGVISSGLLFVYWTVEMVTSLVPFYTSIMLKMYEDDDLEFTVVIGSFVLVVVSFVLQWFSDIPRQRDGYTNIGKGHFVTSDLAKLLEERPCPEVTASFPSKLLIWWITRLVIHGFRKEITEEEMWTLNPRDTGQTLVPRFEKEWNEEKIRKKSKMLSPKIHYNDKRVILKTGEDEKTALLPVASNRENTDRKCKPRHPSLSRVLWRLFGRRFLGITFLKIIGDIIPVLSPLIMGALITYTDEKTSGEEWKGYTLAAALFVTQLVTSIINQYSLSYGYVIGIHLKTVCVAAVYKKALTVSNEARKATTTGEIMNLMSVDCQRINDVMIYIALIVSVPLQITLSVVLIYNTIGPSVFAGLALLFLLIPLNSVLGSWQSRLQARNLRLKDQRIKLLDEIINGIKVLKLYAWEPPFLERVRSVRSEEVKHLLYSGYVMVLMGISWTLTPFLVVLATFAVYILPDPNRQLDANTAFVTLSLYNTLSFPMFRFPSAIVSCIQGYVSMQRVNRFLCSEDLCPENVQYDRTSEFAVMIGNGRFTWDTTISPTLRGIKLKIKEGSLVAVVGQVGSGKSSLLSAILGEMIKLSGTVTIKSSVAYVPQTAWIQNKSLRENILFGRKLRKKKYDTVVDACALDADLTLLPSGDMTEIGEKGINLSGGQKQRVSLARAVYRNEDIYLLDDPLSAVDSHVGKHIFSAVIGQRGLLKGKTRILVTHGVQWLPVVDQIIVMNNGTISETGSYEELMSHDGAFAQFLKTYLTEKKPDKDPEVQEIRNEMLMRLWSLTSEDTSEGEYVSHRHIKQSTSDAKLKSITQVENEVMNSSENGEANSEQTARGKLVVTERAGTGKVKWSVFLMYGRAAGLPTFLIALLLFLAQQALNSGSSFYLTDWTEDPRLMNTSSLLPDEYADLNLTYLGIYSIFALAFATVIASSNYLLQTRMVRASGRLHDAIVRRMFRSPMSFFDTTPSGRIINRLSLDIETIDNAMPINVRMFMNQLSSVAVVLVTISINTPLFISVMIPLVILYTIIQKIYIPTTRQLKRIESVARSPVYAHFSETITGASSIRAYGVMDDYIAESLKRVDKCQLYYFAWMMASRWLSICLDLIGSIIVLAAGIFAVVTPGTSGGIVGLSVSYALQISSSLSTIVRQISILETTSVSVERLKEYSELPVEGEWIKPDQRPPWDWPVHGAVELCGYSTRYREGLDCVLRDITCNISGGQKIGVVGRTGAGKSSLSLALFRLLEAVEGSIVIDGVNIATIGLHDIRSRLTILPQDPVLFSGSLRMNLDPFNQYPDEEVWSALERSHLKEFAKGVAGQLMYDCGEKGDNLSVGQRQLVCLSRSLLRHSKILVLDEATAAVDMETDSFIQTTIREAFKDCTVITIAHRISTVMDYDRILVLDSGRVKEYGTPDDLMKDTSSMFYGLAKSAGIV